MITRVDLDNPYITKYGEKAKSELNLGNIHIMFNKKFNWFNRLMLRLVFGLNIENVKDSD